MAKPGKEINLESMTLAELYIIRKEILPIIRKKELAICSSYNKGTLVSFVRDGKLMTGKVLYNVQSTLTLTNPANDKEQYRQVTIAELDAAKNFTEENKEAEAIG